MRRREFMASLGAMGLSGTSSAGAQAQEEHSPASYREVRSKISGKKFFVLPYSHNDYGWLNSNLWDRERLTLVHKEALEIMRREPDFKWYIDTEMEGLSWFLEACPELFDELKQRIHEGRWAVAAGSFCNPDNLYMEPEAMIRNLVLGRRDFEAKFPGVNLEVAAFNDIHPGYTQIPQLLQKAGYRYYRVTRPVVAMDLKGYKREFIWEGLDGSEIIFSYGPYAWDGGGPTNVAAINNWRQDWEKAVTAFYESAIKAQLPGTATGIILLPLGMDYARPLRSFFQFVGQEPYLDMPGFMNEWARRESVPLIFATPIEYFREIDKSRSRLPRVKGIVDPVGWPYWYGATGSRGLYRWREHGTRALVEAEILCCLGSLDGMEYPAQRLESLWYDNLTLHFHDGLYVGDEDVMALIELGRHVDFSCRELCNMVLNNFSRRIAAGEERNAVAVFNPLSWPRRDLVEIRADFLVPGTTRIEVKDAAGRPVPFQLQKIRHLGNDDANAYYTEAYLLLEATVPPLGYTTFYVESKPGTEELSYAEPRASALENRYARVTLGPTGIEIFEDKVRNAKYEGAGNPVYYAEKDSYHFHGGPVQQEIRISGAEWKQLEDGPLRTSARMKGAIGEHKLDLLVSLHHTTERLDFDLTLDSVGGSGYFAAQVPFEYAGRLVAGIPYGAEPRELSGEPFGKGAGEERTLPDVFFAHHWVDYHADTKGLTLIAAEGQRGFRFNAPRRSLQHILLKTITPAPVEKIGSMRGSTQEWETLFVNRFFPGTGRHQFRYSLIPHSGTWKEAGSLIRAQEQLYPMRWFHVHPSPNASLPQQKSYAVVNPGTVAMSSWQRTASGYQLRLYESIGAATDVTVTFGFLPESCHSVDLNGKPLPNPAIDLTDNSAHFRINPWEVVTLLLRPGRT